MKRSLAFTLVELLAVIVILAIILAIAIPSITGVINSSTRSAFESDARLLLKGIEYKLLEDDTFDITSITKLNVESELGISDDNYDSLKILKNKGKPYLLLTGSNKWEGLTVCGKNSSLMIVESLEDCEVVVNDPILAAGMTPIKWNGTAWVETTASDSKWYNYTEKNWANAKTADGSMWVWVPRYAYQIATNYHTTNVGTINIKFLIGETSTTLDGTSIDLTPTYAGSSQTNYIKHPAFTFGDDELTGIWVAKFEPSNDGSDNVKVVPNATPWQAIHLKTAYELVRAMETNPIYGWGTTGDGIDTHLAKNIEWGMMVYLAMSKYGKNGERIGINPTFTTGCICDFLTGCDLSTPHVYTYETVNGVKASTTGTIYGIYDLSGGSHEKVMANYDNVPKSTWFTTEEIIALPDKYIDRYTGADYGYNSTNFGDAYYETSSNAEIYDGSSWVGDGNGAWFAADSRVTSCWILRSGLGSSGDGAFRFTTNDESGGTHFTYASFRPILAVKSGI